MKHLPNILRFFLVCFVLVTGAFVAKCQIEQSHKQGEGGGVNASLHAPAPKTQTNAGHALQKPPSAQVPSPPKQVFAGKEAKNFWFFRTKIYPALRKAECGACNDLCHFDPKDRGGVTCAGMAMNFNPDFFAWELNSFVKACSPHAGGRGLFCKRRLFEDDLKRRFYVKYARRFAVCAPAAFALLVDSAVLSGPATATKLLQGAGGLKQDGLFGPKTAALCARRRGFPAGRFTANRIARFQGLKQCRRYCVGWIKRARRALKQYKAAAAGGGIKIPAPIFGGY